eukprot:4756058-Pleurochrysis_carterae.AAC.2
MCRQGFQCYAASLWKSVESRKSSSQRRPAADHAYMPILFFSVHYRRGGRVLERTQMVSQSTSKGQIRRNGFYA